MKILENTGSVLKTRLKKEGSEVATNCSRLKLLAVDGKMRLTDVADTEQLLRHLYNRFLHQKQNHLKFGWLK